MDYSHSGAFFMGVRSHIQFRPGMGIGIASLSNGSPSGLPDMVDYCFFELMMGREPSKDILDVIQESLLRALEPENDWAYTPEPGVQPPANLTMYALDYDYEQISKLLLGYTFGQAA